MHVTADLFPARETRAVELPDGATGYELMQRLALAPDVHLLVRGDVPIPIDEKLRDGESVRVIAVVSGG
ncbi:MAG: MoaD/ThiS family protein [Methanobacteriota archaeon]|nr:MAG: MoaD/ThiS family protein [Euryarchaeota archaeon]